MVSLGTRLRHVIGDQFGAQIVEQTLEKAIKEARDRADAPRSEFYDPMQLFMGNQWVAKPGQSLGYHDLRSMAHNPIISSIVATRVNQVAAFCSPRSSTYDIGFEIKSDNAEATDDIGTAAEIKDWIYNAGMTGYGEAQLETFARKFMRDSLILDQACAEIIPRRNGLPAYMVPVDAAHIRRLKASLGFAPPNVLEPMYAFILDDTIRTTYTANQMMFGVRNPQTDIHMAGYGTSELETLVRVVSAIMNTERYNNSQLINGGTSKGLLVVKGDADQQQYDSFKKDFRNAVGNAAQAWRPPVLKISKDADVDWVQLDRSNRDMEFAQLFEFLVRQACGVYQIDPAEINWSTNVGSNVTFEGRSDKKQQASQNRGLKPLLTFLSSQINTNLIQKIDPRYRIEFQGLDIDRQADAEVYEKEVKTFKTVNELRAELGKAPLAGGDILLNPQYLEGLSISAGVKKVQDDTEDDFNQDVNIDQELRLND